MKPRAQKNKKLPGSLLFSLILHLVFMTIWGVFYIPSQKKENDFYIQLEIIPEHRKPPPRALKRPLYFSSISNSPRPQSQQTVIENPVLCPPLPQISSVPQPHLSTEQPLSMVTEESIPLSAATDSIGETDFPSSQPRAGGGKMGTGNASSFGNRAVQIPRSLGLESQTALPEITGLTQPEVALVKIARHLLLKRKSDLIDIVFLIDASQSMRNDIDAVRAHLNQMTDLFKAKRLDFTVGIVVFQDGTSFSLLGWDFQVTPQTNSIQQIKKVLKDINCRGGEKALDALIRAAAEVKFRDGSERRFILVTDEYVSGSYSPKEVLTKLNSEKISVDVIGRDEHFQKWLAQSTGGLWLPISSLKE